MLRPGDNVTPKITAKGAAEVSVTAPFLLAGAEIGPSPEEMQRPALLLASVSQPRRKLAAAHWFLTQLSQCLLNEGSALMFLEAFLTTLRSATFALQKMYAGHPEFAGWYEQKRERMRQDEDLRWLVELRNMSEKEGLVFIEYGAHTVVRYHRSGLVEAAPGTPSLRLADFKDANLLPHLHTALAKISAVVEEATAQFGLADNKTHVLSVEYLRETQEGVWEHFDPF